MIGKICKKNWQDVKQQKKKILTPNDVLISAGVVCSPSPVKLPCYFFTGKKA